MMRNSNLNSVSTENQHEILNKFGKCLLVLLGKKKILDFDWTDFYCLETFIHANDKNRKQNKVKSVNLG